MATKMVNPAASGSMGKTRKGAGGQEQVNVVVSYGNGLFSLVQPSKHSGAKKQQRKKRRK